MDVQTNILYADTNKQFRSSLQTSLQAENQLFNITTVGTVENALEQFETKDFDIVLLDPDLPTTANMDVLKQIRNKNPEIPILLLIENLTIERQTTAADNGATNCFDKDTLSPRLLANNIEAFTTQYTITRKSSREYLNQLESQILKELFEQVPASLYIKDQEGKHIFMSDYDTSPEEVLGKTDLEVYPEEVAKESYKDDMHVIQTGEPIKNKEEYNPENNEWTITSKVPLYNENDEINGLIGVTRFITEEKKYEKELEKKNERLEQFASVISHDLRNPLSVADGYIQIAKEETGNKNLDPAINALDRMETLIEELLQLATETNDELELTNTNLTTIFSEAWSNVNTKSATYNVQETTTFDAHQSRTKQLFENLIRNSIEHSGKNVKIEIGKTDNGFYYQDNGPGIQDERKDDAFNFGTTWSDDGTGFGLAIVKEIAKAHNWNTTLTDSPSGGVRFEFTHNQNQNNTTTSSTMQKRSGGNNSLDAPPALPKGEKP